MLTLTFIERSKLLLENINSLLKKLIIYYDKEKKLIFSKRKFKIKRKNFLERIK